MNSPVTTPGAGGGTAGLASPISTLGTRSAPFVPPKPTMGGLKKISDDDWIVWVGGKPSISWVTLAKPNPAAIEATQYRPLSISSSAKAAHYRTTGLKEKFNRNTSILMFQKEVMDHLTSHGMDTITYLPDPSDKTKMVSIITDHDRFTPAAADRTETLQSLKYDQYDHANY